MNYNGFFPGVYRPIAARLFSHKEKSGNERVHCILIRAGIQLPYTGKINRLLKGAAGGVPFLEIGRASEAHAVQNNPVVQRKQDDWLQWV